MERLVEYGRGEIEPCRSNDASPHEAEEALGDFPRQRRRRKHRDGAAVLGDDDPRELSRRKSIHQGQALRLELRRRDLQRSVRHRVIRSNKGHDNMTGHLYMTITHVSRDIALATARARTEQEMTPSPSPACG